MSVNRVVVERRGRVGHLVLARPEALNALDAGMIDALARGLERHLADEAVALVVVRSDDARAFCAGGDMKRARELVLSDRLDELDAFFAVEYALNLAIAECPKPCLALIDGVAMGGGLGLSVHGSHRIVTERATLAMPETRIGFFPDVGASHFLPRLRDGTGRWLGVTGDSIDAETAVAVGLATHRAPSENLPALIAALEDEGGDDIDAVLARSGATTAIDPAVAERLAGRARWFAADTRDAIVDALEAAAPHAADAERLLRTLRTVSPHSVDITLDLFRDAASRSLADALDRERRFARDAARHPDFVEGIRSVLVDRERHAQPKWARPRTDDRRVDGSPTADLARDA